MEALNSAIRECDKRLVAIGPSEWDLPTPCDEWNVGDLVFHMTWGSALYAKSRDRIKFDDLPELPTREDVDLDPVTHCRRQATASTEIFSKPGAMDVISDWPLRPGTTGAELIEFRMLDLVVHTWDLSRAIGADETLPTPLVEEALVCVRNRVGRHTPGRRLLARNDTEPSVDGRTSSLGPSTNHRTRAVERSRPSDTPARARVEDGVREASMSTTYPGAGSAWCVATQLGAAVRFTMTAVFVPAI